MIRICVADDEKNHIDRLRLFLNRFFPSQEDYTLTVFTNGEDLVQSYAPVYDIIFLDIEMPRLNGMDTARQIRQQDSDVVIISMILNNIVQPTDDNHPGSSVVPRQ